MVSRIDATISSRKNGKQGARYFEGITIKKRPDEGHKI